MKHTVEMSLFLYKKKLISVNKKYNKRGRVIIVVVQRFWLTNQNNAIQIHAVSEFILARVYMEILL